MTTEERFEALERGLSAAKRRNKYLLIGLIVLAVAWAFTSTTGTVRAQSDENFVQAERFELVDSLGNVQGMLAASDEFGPALILNDQNGTIRARLDVSNEFGPMLALYDENGTRRAGLDLVDENGWGLYLDDKNGTLRAGLVVVDDGPGMFLHDENGFPIWSAP